MAKRSKIIKRGFTLVELLLAVVIGALVAVSAVAALRTITASRDRIENIQTVAGEIRFATEMIHKDLENLYRDSEAKNRKIVCQKASGYGTGNCMLTMYCVSSVKARVDEPEGDVYEVEYFIQQNEERSLLMRRLKPNPSEENENTSFGILYPIGENIDVFEVRLLDGGTGEWYSEWAEERTDIPQLIEVRLAGALAGQKKLITNSFLVNPSRWPTAAGAKTEEGEKSTIGQDNTKGENQTK